MTEENADHAGEFRQWTFGGFVLGLIVAAVFCSIFWAGGPRFVILNDGKIIETKLTDFKWVEVDEKTAEVKTRSRFNAESPVITWGDDCEMKNGILVCTSGGSLFNPNDPNIRGE